MSTDVTPDDIFVTSPVNSVHGPPDGCSCTWLRNGRDQDWDLIAEDPACPNHGGES